MYRLKHPQAVEVQNLVQVGEDGEGNGPQVALRLVDGHACVEAE